MIGSGYVQYHDDLKPLMVPIDDVEQHPANYNNGDIDAIVASIETNGMYRPLYVQASTNRIVAGNHTWLACKMLQATEIPVVRLDIDDPTARRLLLADNRIAHLARPDEALLLELLHQVTAEDEGLTGTGWADQDLADLQAQLTRAEHTPLLPDDRDYDHTCPQCGHQWNDHV